MSLPGYDNWLDNYGNPGIYDDCSESYDYDDDSESYDYDDDEYDYPDYSGIYYDDEDDEDNEQGQEKQ